MPRLCWRWLQYHLPAMSQLSRRHLRAVRCKCHGRKHFSPVVARLRSSLGRTAHVLVLGSWARMQSPRGDILLGLASASHLHEVRLEAEEDVQVCSGSRRLDGLVYGWHRVLATMGIIRSWPKRASVYFTESSARAVSALNKEGRYMSKTCYRISILQPRRGLSTCYVVSCGFFFGVVVVYTVDNNL